MVCTCLDRRTDAGVRLEVDDEEDEEEDDDDDEEEVEEEEGAVDCGLFNQLPRGKVLREEAGRKPTLCSANLLRLDL